MSAWVAYVVKMCMREVNCEKIEKSNKKLRFALA